jgi:hypothetical protein
VPVVLAHHGRLKATYQGRVMVVGGRPVELFPVRVMGRACERSTRTIERWEAAGLFPRPLYRRTSTRLVWSDQVQNLVEKTLVDPRRFYAVDQVERIHALYTAMVRVRGTRLQGARDLALFLDRARRVLYLPSLVVDPRTGDLVETGEPVPLDRVRGRWCPPGGDLRRALRRT